MVDGQLQIPDFDDSERGHADLSLSSVNGLQGKHVWKNGKTAKWRGHRLNVRDPIASAKDYAIHLQPKQDVVVETPTLGVNFDEALTLELWIQPDVEALKPNVRSIIAHASHPGVAEFYLDCEPSNRPKVFARYHHSENNTGFSTRGYSLTERRRFHFAGVSERSRIHLYVDGKLIGTQELPLPQPSKPIQHLRIGHFSTDFSGVVDEVRFSRGVRYSKDFTPLVRFEPDKDTLVLLHCDEGRDKWVRDASGHGNDGRITTLGNTLDIRWVRADGSPIPASTQP